MRSAAPVIAIAAHIPSAEIGGNYFQETHPQILFKECSCFCELVSTPEQMPRMLAMAIQAALTHQGVAVIVISGDIALQNAIDTKPAVWPRRARPIITPSPDELDKIAALLNASKRITLLCGKGCANARETVLQLCDTLKSPMVHALRAKEYVEYDNPYDVGMTGFIGFSSGYYAMEDCDTLLMLGTNFPYRQFYPSHSKIIQVDISGTAIGRRCPIDFGVIGDVNETLRQLLPLLKKRDNTDFLDKARKHYHQARKQLDDLAVKSANKQLIHPQYLAKCVDDLAAENTLFTCDVGTPTVWAARYLKMNGKRRLLGSFNHGTMANALSQSIGAQMAYPHQQVVALCGDGGFTMLMGDLITLTQLKLPIKIIIFNNGILGFVELEMKAAGFLSYGTKLQNPNFSDMANAMGIYGKRVTDSEDLISALRDAFSHPGPALIDVVTNPMELVMPPTITAKEIEGFGLYTAKAILSGQGSEVFELIKTNLWQ